MRHNDIFGNVLQKIGAERGAPLMDALRKMPALGLGNRMKALEQQEVKVKNEIVAHVKLDDKGITDALVRGVRPEIEKLKSLFQMQLKNEMEKLRLERQTQARVQFPEQR